MHLQLMYLRNPKDTYEQLLEILYELKTQKEVVDAEDSNMEDDIGVKKLDQLVLVDRSF